MKKKLLTADARARSSRTDSRRRIDAGLEEPQGEVCQLRGSNQKKRLQVRALEKDKGGGGGNRLLIQNQKKGQLVVRVCFALVLPHKKL